jgi:hypothetical protein
MTLEAVKLAAEANQWGAIFPELLLACLASVPTAQAQPAMADVFRRLLAGEGRA